MLYLAKFNVIPVHTTQHNMIDQQQKLTHCTHNHDWIIRANYL